MKTTKLYYYLHSLDPEDRKGFREYLGSPLFNRNQTLLQVFDLLEEHIIENPIDVPRASFYQLLYPGKTFKPKRLRNLLWETLDLLMDYMTLKEFQQEPNLREALRLRAFNRGDRDNYFANLYKKAHEKLSSRPIQSTTFLDRFHLYSEYNQFTNRRPKRTANPNLTELHLSLDHYYLTEKLRFACIALNQERITGIKTELPFIDSVLEMVANSPHQLPKLTRMYFYTYQNIVEPDNDQVFLDLLYLLIQPDEHQTINQDHFQGLYFLALNYCTRKLNQGRSGFREHAIVMYQYALDKGILLDERGQLSPHHFKNIVAVMSRAGAFGWVEDFLVSASPLLESKYRDRALAYNQAILKFNMQEYRGAIQLLQMVLPDKRDIFYELDGRTYLCRSWSRLEEYDELETQLDSFRTYLKRKKDISRSHKERYGLMISRFKSFTRIMQDIPEDRTKKLKALVKTIRDDPHEFRNSWLLREIEIVLEEE